MILSRPNIISLSQYSSGSKVYKNKTYKTRALKYFVQEQQFYLLGVTTNYYNLVIITLGLT